MFPMFNFKLPLYLSLPLHVFQRTFPNLAEGKAVINFHKQTLCIYYFTTENIRRAIPSSYVLNLNVNKMLYHLISVVIIT